MIAELQPIFLVGSIRSGTTLMRLMLDHHPLVSLLGEAEFLFELNDAPLNIRMEQCLEPTPQRFAEHLRKTWVFRESGLEFRLLPSYREMIDDLLLQKPRRTGKPRFGATVHHHFSVIPRFYPQAKYVYLIRDGRDVARSIELKLHRGNMYQAADVWLSALAEWETLKAQLCSDQFVEIRFENLVRDPDSELKKVCSVLGIPFTKQMYSYAEVSTYDLPDESAAERWRRLKPERLIAIERKIAPRLTEYGYFLTCDDPKPPTVALQITQWIDAKSRLAFRRAKRYGLGLYLERQLVKLLPIPPYRRSVLHRMQDIDLSKRK